MIDIEQLTIKEARELAVLFGGAQPSAPFPYQPGDKILIRTVTMTHVGSVKRILGRFVQLENGGWVADTSRFSEALASGRLGEFEKSEHPFWINADTIIDIWDWKHNLPSTSI
jgi:hypothetical protein